MAKRSTLNKPADAAVDLHIGVGEHLHRIEHALSPGRVPWSILWNTADVYI
jgi:hypothetical protein